MRQPKLILVEGPDGAGKTTLVDRLFWSTRAAWRSSCGVPQGPALPEYTRKLIEGWYERAPVVIFDRFHLGEQVYGPIMRNGDSLGAMGCEVLEDILRQFYHPVVVLARPPLESCLDVWRARRDKEYVDDEEKMVRVWESFGNLRTSLRVIDYDHQKDSEASLIKKVLS